MASTRASARQPATISESTSNLSGDSSSSQNVQTAALNYSNVTFGSEIRAAELYTEIIVGDKKYGITALGARGCAVNSLSIDEARSTLVYNLKCDLTYFHAADTELGPVTIIDDPRSEIRGRIFLRRNKELFQLPGLSTFNQYLIFNIGKNFYYYPSPWVVEAAIIQWPPEYHQYHHLEESTPIYDFNTREPNVAVKGISTISILGKLSDEDEKAVREAHAKQVKKVKSQPGYEVPADEFLKKPPKKR